MKNGNVVVACVTLGVAAAPFCAYKTRSQTFFFDSSLEDLLVSALKGENGSQTFWFIAIACAVVGFIVGLLLKRVVQPAEDTGTEPALLRTPVVAAILAPVGIATILLVAYNHTAQVLEGVVWPEFYSKNWIWCSVAAAAAGFILAKLFNTWERAFPQASFFVKLEIICCSPFTACVGIVVMAGLIGSGSLVGYAVGQFYGSPIAGAWMGTCIAIVALAFEKGVFWPAHFSLAA